MRRSPRSIVTTIATAIATTAMIAASLTLAGCSPTSATDYSQVAAQLQERVLAVSVGVAEENWQSASDNLDALEAEVATALTRLEVTPERAENIRNSIDLVRIDVNIALDEANRVTPEPPITPEPNQPDKPEKPEKPENDDKRDDGDERDAEAD
jgi:outer membrane murein-binding lipoprotein Lpp